MGIMLRDQPNPRKSSTALAQEVSLSSFVDQGSTFKLSNSCNAQLNSETEASYQVAHIVFINFCRSSHAAQSVVKESCPTGGAHVGEERPGWRGWLHDVGI